MLFGNCESSGFVVREDGFMHCNYCGSLHPVELAKLIEEGIATLHGTDWKYGYPHKFYVTTPNPNAGETIQIGSNLFTENGVRINEPIMGKASEHIISKFYTNHFTLMDNETFEKVAPIISMACGIAFFKRDGVICYSAPHMNYQKD